MSDEAHQCWIVFTWINTQPLLQYTSPTHCCSTSYSHIKQLPQRITCTNRRHCITKSCSQLCMCSSTPCHWTIYCQVISSFFTWILTVTSMWIPTLSKPLYKSHLHLPLQNIYTYRSPIYIYPCRTSTHTDLKSMHNWMLPRFPDNYRRERDSDERE